jgi:hypothetical protein
MSIPTIEYRGYELRAYSREIKSELVYGGIEAGD